ncbi:DUF4301 family protein [Marinilongibacter aquaticus]|uniref:DUF4301 family protein n=1 Tax=Marinilongibacter aquaticus TaxID=2975157 RepID=UPI0021BD8730|nr:DUF4301 family protein [Marinilongibacter aquaticus]UBM60861.1 DUF4301 family protein [Marinilongibacter aquaticus]
MFTEKDIAQIDKRGSDLTTIKTQIENFKTGFPFVKAKKAATIGDGLLRMSDEEVAELVDLFDKESSKKKLLKFVPASGAASRMFKALFAAKDEGKTSKDVDQFVDEIERFAFYKSLMKVTEGKKDREALLKGLLESEGLDYGSLPKGLLEFHKYDENTRTAVEEHMVEGAAYANRNGRARLHFTVSPEHKSRFNALIKAVKKQYEEAYGVQFIFSFSEQKASTDTIAVNKDNSPFRLENGSILFRPAGHGALLENLNDQDADIIFIKNIDNVVPDHLKGETIKYKKVLAGKLIQVQKQLFNFARRLDKADVSAYTRQKALKFLKEELNVTPPKGFRNWSDEDKLAYAKSKINRPIRVCGMVKNVGEPGGGPFWLENTDGSVSTHIVESAQFNFDNKRQSEIFQHATHFNPVDLVVSTKNHNREKFNLLDFRDPQTGFVTEKSMSGKALKAQELPGLWNGSMSDWNTLFVEVPLITFNPVKTVNDLLRKEHQPE